MADGTDALYFCGNSLGLMPKATASLVEGELKKWSEVGVKGHFEGAIPWATCEELLPELFKDIVGADDPKLEICVSNALTVNLHMLMAAFYRPTAKRSAILIEAAAFPSDRYATASQIMQRGFDPNECLIEVTPENPREAGPGDRGLLRRRSSMVCGVNPVRSER